MSAHSRADLLSDSTRQLKISGQRKKSRSRSRQQVPVANDEAESSITASRGRYQSGPQRTRRRRSRSTSKSRERPTGSLLDVKRRRHDRESSLSLHASSSADIRKTVRLRKGLTPIARARLLKQLKASRSRSSGNEETLDPTNLAKVTKSLSSLKTDLALSKLTQLRQMKEIKTLEDDLAALSEISDDLMCGICRETFSQPCAIIPCGHVFCESCLIDAFTAPPLLDSDDETAHQKRCPQCRSLATARPVRIYALKALAGRLGGERDPPSYRNPFILHQLFPLYADFTPSASSSDDSDNEASDDDSDGSHEGLSEPNEEEAIGLMLYWGEAELFDRENTFWKRPTPEPPKYDARSFFIPPHTSSVQRSLLLRGVPHAMIRRYAMSYTNQHGVGCVTDRGTRLFLGWNLTLHEDDLDGSHLLAYLSWEIQARPNRWVLERTGDVWTGTRLMRASGSEIDES
ncbi:hypothetical protein SISNIDRAFT_549176 [Sistotremastrum niveocremeum HHB9708]|uniref:RING-type domain-containing protein n=1 Tax=Sistotremastrum niveocremeum HHB9708 TaxID=1314777 RepID=A0A164W092_9AGAM|nr:hypothetical protein SISNIDRAFT_549176 [Sistotremastrum niveocremeum HHB9708]